MTLTQREADDYLVQYEIRKRLDPLSVYCPYPKQLLFHKSVAHKTLFIAGNGTGKTFTLAREVAMAATGRHVIPGKYPVPSRGRIGGEREALENEIIPMLHQLLDNYLDGAPKRNSIGMEFRWKLKNGSTFDILTYGQEDKHWESVSLDWLAFDEPFRESIWDASLPRMRKGKGGHIFIAMTPLLGSAWMLDRIVRPYTEAKAANEKSDVYIVRANVWDNCMCLTPDDHDENGDFPIDNDGFCHCHGGYVHKQAIDLLIEEWDEEMMAARRDGEFIVMRDIVHPRYDTEIHVLDPEIMPEKVVGDNMQLYTVLDPHRVRPAAWGIYAISPTGVRYTLDEWPSFFTGKYKGFFYNRLKSCNLSYDELIEIWHAIEMFWTQGNTKLIRGRFIDPRYAKEAMHNTRMNVMQGFNKFARDKGYDMRFRPAIVGGDTDAGEIDSGLAAINATLKYVEDSPNSATWYDNVRCANHIRAMLRLRVQRRSGKSAEGRSPSEELLDEFKDFSDLKRYFVKSVKGYKTIITRSIDEDENGYKPHCELTGY